MSPEQSPKKTPEASKESPAKPSTPSAPSSASRVEEAKTQAPPTAPSPESKVIPLKGVTPSEKQEAGCSGKESEKKAS